MQVESTYKPLHSTLILVRSDVSCVEGVEVCAVCVQVTASLTSLILIITTDALAPGYADGLWVKCGPAGTIALLACRANKDEPYAARPRGLQALAL